MPRRSRDGSFRHGDVRCPASFRNARRPTTKLAPSLDERGGQVKTDASNWRDVKTRARAADPAWDGAERVARRRETLASVSGAQLAEFRQQSGMLQTQLAEAAGFARRGSARLRTATPCLETLRAAVTGLGDHLDVVARISA